MSMRVHTAQAARVALSVVDGDQLVDLYGDEFAGIERALIVEDTFNCEALVLVGDLADLADFGLHVVQRVNTTTVG